VEKPMIGPRVSIKLSCIDCDACHIKPGYGPDTLLCLHPDVDSRIIGETLATPAWCPVIVPALQTAIAETAGRIADVRIARSVPPA
jgi:hypothetical protein